MKTPEELAQMAHEREHLQDLDKMYTYINLKHKAAVKEFVIEHNLNDLLLDAPHHIAPIFKNAPLVLDLFTPMDDPENSELVLQILTDLEPLEAHAKMRDLHSSWWLDLPNEVLLYMTITTRSQ